MAETVRTFFKAHPWIKTIKIASGALLAIVLTFVALDMLFPFPPDSPARPFSVVIAGRDGAPLRTFADEKGIWRYPVDAKDVSPLYLEALLGYEDRWFYRHPGVNPFSLFRAVWQAIVYERFVSGGSTLTMQVARLIVPNRRTGIGKLKQIFRAVQMELRYSKKEILNLYLNIAPFGGPVEGVQAASFTYFGKSAKELSHAEAALLAVIPQSPTRLRPDRHPEKAEKARNKVLDRLSKFEIWDPLTVKEAKMEHVTARFRDQPHLAPLLARRLKPRARDGQALVTTVDPSLQRTLENMLTWRLGSLPENTSIAVLVAENETLAVRAYLGSADFLDASRFGHVDMIRAVRSPGSTLKPFLYAMAMEDGLIHSESLLVDAPQSFGGYRPGNFRGGFYGPVSAREALQKSLNVPAVDLIDRYSPERFAARLRNGGLKLKMPDDGRPNLSIILGGAGTTLEDLVAAYTAFARGGMAGELRFTEDDPVKEHRMMSEGAAWIVRDILETNPRPGFLGYDLEISAERPVAWKTGTSYGFRDAWAVGVTDRYTVGVWVGRPDGTPMPGRFGADTAAPLLFDIVDGLHPDGRWNRRPPKPASVEKVDICWPLGAPPEEGSEDLCHIKRSAWVLDGVIPPTFPDRTRAHWSGAVQRFLVNPATGNLVDERCGAANRVIKVIAKWPAALEPWLPGYILSRSTPPPPDETCPFAPPAFASDVIILGMPESSILKSAGVDGKDPSVALTASGGRNRLYWIVNGETARSSGTEDVFHHRFDRPGVYEITVMDEAGGYDRITVEVMG